MSFCFLERLLRPVDLSQPGEISGIILFVLALALLIVII